MLSLLWLLLLLLFVLLVLTEMPQSPPDDPRSWARVLAFVGAQNSWGGMLMNYKLWVNGKLASVGPGRGEAPVVGGDGRFRAQPYNTVDITPFLDANQTALLSLVTMQSGGVNVNLGSYPFPCATGVQCNGPSQDSHGPALIMQVIAHPTGGGEPVTFVTGDNFDVGNRRDKCTSASSSVDCWKVRNADDWFKPLIRHNKVPGPCGGPGCGDGGGSGRVEHTDARREPVGWRDDLGYNDSSAGWEAAADVGKGSRALKLSELQPRMAGAAVQVTEHLTPLRTTAVPSETCGATLSGGAGLTCRVIEQLHLGCPAGGRIVAVDFASFGTPAGNCSGGFATSAGCDDNASKSRVEALCLGKQACRVPAFTKDYGPCAVGRLPFPCNKRSDYRLAAKVRCSGPQSPPPKRSFFVDFGQEFSGGVRLVVQGGTAGQGVKFQSGELCSPMVYNASAFGGRGQNVSRACTSVGESWGWSWNVTLRGGDQTIEQHQYMVFRYLTVDFAALKIGCGSPPCGSVAPPPADWSVSGWGVNAPWDPADTHFSSDSTVLDRVWKISENTLQRGVLDTYTDSNARERRPYEADGLIAAGGRMMLQSNSVLWARHSHSWIFTYPTWPVEWLQITPFLAHLDYWATGSTDLADAFFLLLFNNTQIHALDAKLGLVNTTKPGSRDQGPDALWNRTRDSYTQRGVGHHLVGWAPGPHDGSRESSPLGARFNNSDFLSTSNFYTARGLELLAEMATAAGRAADAKRCADAAAALKKSIVERMWDRKSLRFCDGICADPKVGGHHSIYADMYSLWLGMVPAAGVRSVWNSTTAWGMEGLGDLGMWAYLNALSSASAQPAAAADGGRAALHALTKCDEDSWCHQVRDHDATMTRESPYDSVGATMSHLWGASAVKAVVESLAGLRQTAPAWATFEVKPRLGGLQRLSLKVPSARGAIWVNATPTGLRLNLPCNTLVKACLLLQADSNASNSKSALALQLDGEEVAAVVEGPHLCAAALLGCGAKGADRVLSLKTDDHDQGLIDLDLFTAGVGGYACYRLPNLVSTAPNHLLAIVQGHKYDCSDGGRLDVLSRSSTDGGATWGVQKLVYTESNATANVTLGTPAAVQDMKSGKTFLLLCRNFNTVLLLTSADGGGSWSGPRDLTSALVPKTWTGVFAGLPQGIQLTPPSAHAGRLLVCANHLTAQGGHSHVIYTDDGGGTWANSASVQPSHTGECSLAQTSGGGSAVGGAGTRSAVLLYARVWWDSTPGSANKSTRALASSADGGATFCTANVSAFPGNPGTDTQGAMVSTGRKDGRLLVSSPWGEKHFPRTNFTVLISSGDDPSAAGFRWFPMPGAAPLYAGASEYSSLLSTPETQRSGTFFVFWERGGSGSAVLRLTQLQLPPKGYGR